MGKKTLDDGEVVDISFDGSAKGCHWDMMVDWADGSKPSQFTSTCSQLILGNMTLYTYSD
jgi:hypothetical protein